TDVGVVDVAIDDVGDDVVRMAALANLIGGGADGRDVVRLKQRGAILNRQPLAVEYVIENSSNLGVSHRFKSSDLRNNTQSAASNKPLLVAPRGPMSGSQT